MTVRELIKQSSGRNPLLLVRVDDGSVSVYIHRVSGGKVSLDTIEVLDPASVESMMDEDVSDIILAAMKKAFKP